MLLFFFGAFAMALTRGLTHEALREYFSSHEKLKPLVSCLADDTIDGDDRAHGRDQDAGHG